MSWGPKHNKTDLHRPRAMQERPVVVFDVGGVLYEDLIDALVRTLARKTRLPASEVRKAYLSRGLRDDLWKGLISTNVFWATMGHRLGTALSPEVWDRKCLEFQRPLFPASDLTSISELAGLAILTNHRAEWLIPVLQRDNLSALFDVIVISSEVGLAKPDARIYMNLLTKLEGYGRCIYVDDKPRNLEPARALGLDVALAKERGHLVTELRDWISSNTSR